MTVLARLRRPLRLAAARSARSRPFARVVDALERLDPPGRGLLPVLMYHRIGEPGDGPLLDPRLLSATPAGFAEQMELLAAHRRVLSLGELLDVCRGAAELPSRAVMVTFDDASRDFAEHAWPVLRRLGLPVTVFVPTAYPGDSGRAFWWDRLHAAVSAARKPAAETPAGRLPLTNEAERGRALRLLQERVRALPHDEALGLVEELERELDAPPPASTVLGWPELRALAESGVALAPHTQTHPLLDRISSEQARAEIAGSARDLERELGSSPPAFAYPGGALSDEVVGIVAEEGFLVAFTTERGNNDLRRPDWLRLRRINVGRRSSAATVRAQLLALPALARGRAAAVRDGRRALRAEVS